MEIDASKLGWGATCKGTRTGGFWSALERELLRNIGGAFTVKSFVKGMSNVHVLLRMDNHTAVSYMNKMGETLSLLIME